MSVVMRERASDGAGAPVWHKGTRWAWPAGVAGLIALAAWVAVADPEVPLPAADARPLPSGAAVRVQLDRLGEQWLVGRVVTAPLGCTLVRLDDARRAGASSVPLREVRELHRIDGGGAWAVLPVAPLLAGEPAGCATG